MGRPNPIRNFILGTIFGVVLSQMGESGMLRRMSDSISGVERDSSGQVVRSDYQDRN